MTLDESLSLGCLVHRAVKFLPKGANAFEPPPPKQVAPGLSCAIMSVTSAQLLPPLSDSWCTMAQDPVLDSCLMFLHSHWLQLSWQVQLLSSAFALSVAAPLGTSKGTPPITSQIPGISTLPLSTPQQTTGSPVGTEIMSTTEEFPHSSSNLTSTAPQGPSTPSSVWIFRDYKVILAPDGIGPTQGKYSLAPHRAPGGHFLFSPPVLTQALETAGQPGTFLALKLTGHALTFPCMLFLDQSLPRRGESKIS